MSKTILILGARSDIALACAHRYAGDGYGVLLAARNAATLEPAAQDLRLRHGVGVTLHDFDALQIEGFTAFLDALPALPDVALCAVGAMGDQTDSQRDPGAASRVLRANFEGPALILGMLAERFEARGSGRVIGITSVAGDRGRASNYVYGSAKAGLSAFLSGLRNRMARGPVRVITVKPGFVATRMTEGLPLNPRLTATPEAVAEAIWSADSRKRDVVYVKPVWRLVMAIIRALPEAIFKKTRL